MPKITKHGGASIWPGNNFSQSPKKQEISETNQTEQDQQLAPMTENLSEKDQTESYSVPLMDGPKDSWQ